MKVIESFNLLTKAASPVVRDYVNRLESIQQGRTHHPEGNVLVHTKIVYRRAVKTGDINIILAAFFHDLGKVDTTKPNGRGGFSAHDHETVSGKLTKFSRDLIIELKGDPDIVHWLVINHMRVKRIEEMKPKKRKDLTDHIWFPKLAKFTLCDDMHDINFIDVILANGNALRFLWNKFRS